jgi:polar amino acid transport system substrate-binding protein
MRLVILFFISLIVLNANEKVIVLANETSWEPHYGKELKNGGYTTEITREALKRVGYELKIKWLPWKRALVMAEKGIFDGLGASYYTTQRAKVFEYSNIVANTQTVFFKLKDKDIKYLKLEDLKPYKIGIGAGYAYPKSFTDADYLNKEIANKLELNVKKLLNKRVDLIIGSKKVILSSINKNFKDDNDKFEMVLPPLESLPLYISFSKKSPNYLQKIKDFNRGLDMIKSDGTYDKIMEKYGF